MTRIGEECSTADVPFFLEIVSYHDDMDEKSAEFARVKPEVVARSVEEFCKPQYAVDVLKVGVPVNMNFVESSALPRSQAIYSRAEAIAAFPAGLAGGNVALHLSFGGGEQRDVCGGADTGRGGEV